MSSLINSRSRRRREQRLAVRSDDPFCKVGGQQTTSMMLYSKQIPHEHSNNMVSG
jgi:hypothetical protein